MFSFLLVSFLSTGSCYPFGWGVYQVSSAHIFPTVLLLALMALQVSQLEMGTATETDKMAALATAAN